MQVALQHHQQIRETVDSIRVHQHSILLVLTIEGNTKCLDYALHDL